MKYTNLLSSLDTALAEAGPINNVATIQQGIRRAGSFPALVNAAVYLSKAVSVNNAHPFWAYCGLTDKADGLSGDYCCNLYTEDRLPIRKLGAPFAALTIVVLDENLADEDLLLHYLDRHILQCSMVVVLNYTGSDSFAKILKQGFFGKFMIVDMLASELLTLAGTLDANITPELKERLRERCFLNTLQPLVQITKEAIQQEQYISTVRKSINGQLSSVLRKEEAGANIGDTLTNVKTQLQYWNSDIEKAIKLKYDELNKPMTGRYSQNLYKWSVALKDLDKNTVAEKAERLVTAINPQFLTDFEKQVSTEVTSDFASDYNFLLTEANSTMHKLNGMLEQKGITERGNKALSIDYSRFPNPEKTLSNYIGFTRMYFGELSKKGAAEYFAALREHTSSIMVAVGLLAPLNMIASAAGTEGGGSGSQSFMGSLAMGMRHIRAYINFTTAFIIIIMIIWGYFDLRKRIPRRREEEFDRELKKARETLQTEGKRMFTDLSRDWQANVAQWAREAYTQLQVQLDKAVRDFTGTQQQKINDEKTRIQRLNQGLDNNIKLVANADKAVDNLFRSHKDAITELEKAFR